MRRRLLLLLGTVLLCLGIMPVTAYAARTEGYEVSTDWVTGTTTYRFTDLEKVERFLVKPEGDAILDFTETSSLGSTSSLGLYVTPQKEGAHVTIRGAEDTSYGNVTLNVDGSVAGVTLQDFQTRSSLVNYGGEGACKIVYDGNCVIDLQLGGADYIVCAADDASHLDLGFASQGEKGSVTFSGNLSVESSLTSGSMTIKDALVSFGTREDDSEIIATKLRIEDSTIGGVGHINSVEVPNHAEENDALDESYITIANSQISFDADVFEGNSSSTVLGNTEAIKIEGSTVTGLEMTDSYGCLGGIFKSIVINNSEVYAKSEYAAAIGPSDSAYGSSGFSKFGFEKPSIIIEDSVIEAASTYGAAIGMPRLPESDLAYDRPQLSVTISGTSDVTATSVRSAAIGASSSKEYGDVGGVEIEVGAGDITWGRSSELRPLGRFLSLLGLAGESSLEGDLATAAELLSGCAVTIVDSPTINAKSGVMAVYADSVSVTDTNLVQDTMVIADGGDEYSIYPMETPGAVKIGSEVIGELGYGYASVAATGVSAQSDAKMTFGDAALTDAEKGGQTFGVSDAGFQRLFTTPTLELSGTVGITGASNGTAPANTTLGLDLSALVPSRAAIASAGTYDGLTFQWHRDGAPISDATSSTYGLTSADDGAVITCVVKGRGFFMGSVTSDAVLVSSQPTVAAPTLESRTATSITLKIAGDGYEYRCVGNGDWQASPTFSELASGTTYAFQQRNSPDSVSAPASFSTLSLTPPEGDFAIDYVSETLSFPSGVYLYRDAACTSCLNKSSSKTSIDISGLIGDAEVTLYARYATVDPADTDSVTEVTIPARPAAPELAEGALAVTSDSIRLTGTDGVAYRLLSGGRVLQTAMGDGSTTITFADLSPATTYTIEMRVEACNDAPATFRSEVAEKDVTTAASAPTAPQFNVQAELVDEGYASVRVGFSWDHPAANGATIDGYAVYAQEGEGELFLVCEVAADATSCDVTAGSDGVLRAGGTYDFTLRASWSAGDASGEVTSEEVRLMLPSLRPDPAAFTFDYLNETLAVPAGVSLYEDAACTTPVSLDDKNVADITPYISAYGTAAQSLYARSDSAADGTDAVTEIEIPRRPYVSDVDRDEMTVTHDSLTVRKRFLNLNECSYELKLGANVISPTTDNDNVFIYTGLTPGTTYSLVITKSASESSFSSSVTQEIVTKDVTEKASDLLVPAASRPSWETVSYDFSDLLGEAEIRGVSEVADSDNILNYAGYDTTGKKAVNLQLRAASVGASATVEVEAQLPDDGDYLVITLTLKAVDVMAEGADGTYWVRADLADEEVAAVESALDELLDGADLLGAFDLTPLDPVGGEPASEAESTQVSWAPEESVTTTGTFEVYRIDDGAASELQGVTQEGAEVSFAAEGAGGRYAVVFRPTTYEVSVAQTLNGSLSVDRTAAKVGETVFVTASPASGYKVESISASYGSASLTPAPQANGTYAFEMPAADVTVSAMFALIPPAAPSLSVTSVSTDGAVVVTWELADDGAVVTGLSLAVSQDGQPVEGFPIEIPVGETSRTLTGLTPGATYELTLTASNGEASATSAAVEVNVPEPEDPTYAVSVADGIKNGSLTVSLGEATAGEKIIITPRPATGYEVASVAVAEADSGASVAVTPDVSGGYVFEMPAADVTVSASFDPIAPAVPQLAAESGAEEGSLVATWTLKDNGAVITGYELAVTLDGKPVEGSPFSLAADATSHTLSGLTSGATYVLTLTAYNNGRGTASEAVTVTVPETQYEIAISKVEHGSFSASYQSAAAGTDVTIVASPDEGYEVASIAVTATGGADVPVEGMSFEMPAADVTVFGAFAPIEPELSAFDAAYDEGTDAVVVSWALADNGAVVTRYELAVTLDGKPVEGSPLLPAVDATSYELTSLAPGATYELTLTAYNDGASATSDTVEVTVPEPVAPTYAVDVATVAHGSFSASPASVAEGDPVTVTASPEEGYETASVTVTDADGALVQVTEQADGTFAFTMPASNVTVSGAFQKVSGDDDPDENDLNALLAQAFEKGNSFEAITLSSGTYKLTADLSVADLAGADSGLMTTSLYIGNDADGATVELDLQGHTLDAEDCALIVTEGSTLNLTDSVGGGSISGRKGLSFTDAGTEYAYAGGIAVYGTLNMSGGSITGNQAAGDGVLGYGGGVYVFGGGIFNMYGGTISGNTASTLGGGVAVRSAADTTPVPNPLYVGDAEIRDWNEVDGGDVVAGLSIGLLGAGPGTESGSSAGTFNLYGGTITGNTAPVAGGIYAGGSVTIGTDGTTPAAVSVTGNTSGNLYVPAGVTVELSATPAAGSKVGVTMEKAPGLFATATSEVASASRACFTSDSGTYYVTSQQDGLALAYVPVAPTYEPEIEVPGGGGTVTTNPRYPEQGDEVTITPVPDEGKTVDTVQVVDKDGEPVEVVDNGDGTWTYKQPAGSVTITVTFVCDGGELCPSAHLVDVDQSKWCHLAIDWAVTHGAMRGYGDGTVFGPDDVLTRAQMAGVLYNLAGQPEAVVDRLPGDCDASAWYAECVAWALEEGVFNGYGDGSTFGPDDPLTREQAAAVLMNAAELSGADTSARAGLSGYPDAGEVSGWAREALSWAVAEGVLHGVDVEGGGRELQPGRACTRAEMAGLMMNLALRS